MMRYSSRSSIITFVSAVLIFSGVANAFTTTRSSALHHTPHSHASSPAPTSIIIRSSSKEVATNLHMVGNNDIEGNDRIFSVLPYIVPLLDGDRYGRYLFYLFPPLGFADSLLLGPFKLIYGMVPFAQFIFFIGLSVLSRNPSISRPVRFNMQQALILDIALIFPGLLGGIPAPAIIANTGSNCVYLAMVGCVGYALISNLSGKVPDKIPLISDAAGMQVP